MNKRQLIITIPFVFLFAYIGTYLKLADMLLHRMLQYMLTKVPLMLWPISRLIRLQTMEKCSIW
jgi:hypothetical protein